MANHRITLCAVLMVALIAPRPGQEGPGNATPAAPAPPSGSILFVENAGQWPEAARFQVWGSPAGAGTTWLAEEAIWVVVAADDRVTGWQGDTVTRWQGDRVTGWQGDRVTRWQGDRVTRWQGDRVTRWQGDTVTRWQGDTGNSSNSVVTRSPSHPVTQSPSHPVTRSPGHPVTLSSSHPVTRSPGHPVTQSPGHRVIRLTFPNANPHPQLEPLAPLTTTVSYFLGDDPALWRSDVPVFGGVRYAGLYPGIDLVLGEDDAFWRLEAQPGAATRAVQLRIEGAAIDSVRDHTLRLTANGHLLTILLPAAGFSYQVAGLSPQQEEITLGVDPVAGTRTIQAPQIDNSADLIYSTFFGGDQQTSAYSIAVDDRGQATFAGFTSSTNMPTTPGVFDPSPNGDYDSFVARLSADGGALVYSTFLGGRGFEWAHGVALDTEGRAVVTGITRSDNFPTTAGAFDRTYNGGYEDGFVACLSPGGDALIYGTYLGGSESEWPGFVDLDPAGRATVAGATNSIDFPTTSGAYDTSFNGGNYGDAFVVRLALDGSRLVYGTYIGGTDSEFTKAIAVDDGGNAVVVGHTSSVDFPTTPGAFDTTLAGGYLGDVFVARLSEDGGTLLYGTYLGSTLSDVAYGVAVDEDRQATVIGYTQSRDFPTTPGAYDRSYNYGTCDIFVTRFDADGTTLVYSTYLGGRGYDTNPRVAVDEAGRAFVAGQTTSIDFPITAGAFDTSHNGDYDVGVATLSADGSALLYGTYLGGSRADYSFGVAVDGSAVTTIAGATLSSAFPTTPGAFDPTFNGGFEDATIAKLDARPYVPAVVAPVERPQAGSTISGTVLLSGFAVDLGSDSGTGVDRVHIYLDGPYATGSFLGAATYGIDRPDVAAQYGDRFLRSGWTLAWNTWTVAPGSHRLYLYAHRTTDYDWTQRPPHVLTVRNGRPLWLPLAASR